MKKFYFLMVVMLLASFSIWETATSQTTVKTFEKILNHEQPSGIWQQTGKNLGDNYGIPTFDNPNYYYASVQAPPADVYYRQAGLSPDGTKIVAGKQYPDGSYTRREVVLMNADGTEETVISPGNSGQGDIYQYGNPFWSDDGNYVGFCEVHNSNPNKVILYNISNSTSNYIYEPTSPDDVSNPDFLGGSTTSIVFWAYGPTGGADLFIWNGTTLTNITNTADYKEYEPVSNADGTVILYWSGETTAEPVNTTHTLTYSGGTWTKDVGFTPISDTYWSYWTDNTATGIATTIMSSKDIFIYDTTGSFVLDLTGTSYSGGSGQSNFFGSGVEGPGGEMLFTSNAGRVNAGRDIVMAAPRQTTFVDAVNGSDSYSGTENAPFATISKGVQEVAAGGTVTVAAGTYPENVIINKSLTLYGANANVACGSRGSESLIAPTSGLPVSITADGVTFSGFEITTPGYQNAIICGNRSNLSILYNYIHNIGNTVSGVNVHAISYGVVNGATTSNVSITYNCLEDIGSATSTHSCSAIGFTQRSSTGVLNGLTIEHNTIQDINANPATKGAYGIQLGVGGTGGGQLTGVSVSYNEVSYLEGLWAHGIGLEGNTPSASVQYNYIHHVTDHKSPADPDAAAIMVEENTGANTVNIYHNKFENVLLGVRNNMAATVDADNNYWGSVNEADVYAKLLGQVDASPWCNSDFSTCDYSFAYQDPVTGVGYATFQDVIDDAPDGAVIEVTEDVDLAGLNIDADGKQITFKNTSGQIIYVTSGSPALTVVDGDIIFEDNFYFTTATNDPTILVTGGSLTLDNCTIQESTGTGINQSGIDVQGGIVSVTHSTFLTDGTGLAVKQTGGTVMAEGNFWGGLTPAYLSSKITGTVDYTPWCNATFTLCDDNGGPYTTAPKLIRPIGAQIVVPIRVTRFNDVTSISLKLSYNNTQLEFDSAATSLRWQEGFQSTDDKIARAGNGVVSISYYGDARTIADNDTLIGLVFNTTTSLTMAELQWLENDISSTDLEYTHLVSGVNAPYYDYQTPTYYIDGYVKNGTLAFTREYPGYPPVPGATTQGIIANVTGGTGTYTYSWVGPSGFTGNTQRITPVNYGNYTVTVTDGGGATIEGTYYYDRVHNINSMLDYQYILQGISASLTDNGDTLVADNGLYIESNILVNKSLTIIGQSRDGVIVAPAAEDGNADNAFGNDAQNGFIVLANSVTIKDLTLNGRGNTALTAGKNNFRTGIVSGDASYPGGGGGTWNNLHVNNVHVKYPYRRGISVFPNTVSGTVIENSTIEYVAFNHGMYVAGQCEVLNDTIHQAFQGIVTAHDAPTPSGLIKINGNVLTEIGNYTGCWGYTASPSVSYVGQPRAIQFNNADPAGRQVEIKNNIISDNGYEAFAGAVGIYTRLANSSSVVEGNQITLTSGVSWANPGSQNVGMLLGWSYDNGFLAKNNTINSTKYGIGIMVFGNGTATHPLYLEGNTLTSTNSLRLDEGDGSGIYIANQYLFASDQNPSYVIIRNDNKISGYVRGIDVVNIPTSTQPLTVQVLNNCASIYGNTIGINANYGDLTITANDIYNNGTGVSLSGAVNLLSMTNNFIRINTGDGILIDGGTTGTISEIKDNSITGNGGYGLKYLMASPTVYATCNWWGSAYAGDVYSEVSGNVDATPFLTSGDDLGGVPGDGFQPSVGCNTEPVKVYTDDSYNDLVATYTTIQKGVDGALPTYVVFPDAGTYTEQVTINKSLTLHGNTGATPVVTILAPDTRSNYVNINPVGPVNYDYVVAAYQSSGTINVKIENIKIDANGQDPETGNKFTGMLFRDVAGTGAGFFNSVITNFGNHQENYGLNTYGISNLTIDNNNISDYQRNGITAGGNGDGGSDDPVVTITDNTITGSAETGGTNLSINGIQLSWGAGGTISGNTIKDNDPDASWAGCGILISENAAPILINLNNQISNVDDGIGLLDADNVTINGNTLSNILDHAVLLDNSSNNFVQSNIFSLATSTSLNAAVNINNGSTGNVIGGSGFANTFTLATSGTGNLRGVNISNSTGSGSNTISYNTFNGGLHTLWQDFGTTGTTTVTYNTIGSTTSPVTAGLYFDSGLANVKSNTMTFAGTVNQGIFLNNACGNNSAIGGDLPEDGNTITMAASGTGNQYAIQISAAGNNDFFIKNNTISYGQRGVQVDGPQTTSGGTITIASNNISNTGFGAITSYDKRTFAITGNTMTNNARPIELRNALSTSITSNVIYGSTFDAILLANFTGATTSSVSNNTISGATNAAGICGQSGANDITINCNEISACSRGIKIDAGCEETIITNNEIHDNTYSAVELHETVSTMYGNFFKNTPAGNVRGIESLSGSLTANNNYFSGFNYGAVIFATNAGGTYDVTDNWWDSSDGPAAFFNGPNVASYNQATQGEYIQANNNSNFIFAPWLTSGTDSDTVTCGFQQTASFAPVYANADNSSTETQQYHSIQSAHNGTSLAYIRAKYGTYTEKPVISKSLTVTGLPSGGIRPIITGSGLGNVVTMSANNITFTGFEVQNSGTTAADAAILLRNDGMGGVTGCSVTDNEVSSNASGVAVILGSGNSITDNDINNNSEYGVVIIGSSNNTVQENEIYEITKDAIALDNLAALTGNPTDESFASTYNSIKTNIIHNIDRDGIFIGYNCSNNGITNGNNLYGIGSIGVHVWRNGSQTITGNGITNALVGLKLRGMEDGIVTNNTITGNDVGIEVEAYYKDGWHPAIDNTITHNDLSGNTTYGMKANEEHQTELVVAQCNWWGSNNISTISAYNTTNVDYIPWLINNGDSDPGVGFVPTGACDGNPIISGTLKYNNEVFTPMNGVSMQLMSDTTEIATATTTSNGTFTFDDVDIDLGSYTIVPDDSPKIPGSINSTDAAQVHNWSILHGYAIEYVRFLAGDVYGNGGGTPNYQITSTDAKKIQLQYVYNGTQNHFQRDAWSYWKETGPIYTTDVNFGSTITTTVTNSDVTENLYGIVTGDFNSSFLWNAFKGVKANVSLTYGEELAADIDTEIELPLRLVQGSDLRAASLILNFQPELAEILDVTMKDNPGNLDWAVSGDELRIGWNSAIQTGFSSGEVLFNIRLRTTTDFVEGTSIRFTVTPDPLNELADADINVIPDAELSINVVKSSAVGIVDPEVVSELSLQSYPNPFTNHTTLTYALPSDGQVTLEISNMFGMRILVPVDGLAPAGKYTYTLNALPLQPGVYTARLTLQTAGGDMVKTIKLVRNR